MSDDRPDDQAASNQGGSDQGADDRKAARDALDRAHAAALDANGAELRRALDEAHEVLERMGSPAAAQIGRARADLDTGSLAELETLLEEVRRGLPAE